MKKTVEVGSQPKHHLPSAVSVKYLAYEYSTKDFFSLGAECIVAIVMILITPLPIHIKSNKKVLYVLCTRYILSQTFSIADITRQEGFYPRDKRKPSYRFSFQARRFLSL